jgi:hypothetical protein
MDIIHTSNSNSCQNSNPPTSKHATSSTQFVEDDLGKAAFLHARGYSFIGLHDLGRGRFGFTFEDPGGTAAQDAAIYFGAEVRAHELVESLRFLKTVLVSEKRNRSDYAHEKPRINFHRR